MIKRNHIGTQPSLFFAFFFDRRNGVAARFRGFIGRHTGLYCHVHPRCYIFGGNEHVELEIGALDLLRVGFRAKAIFEIVMLLARSFLQRIRADVVVRDYESVCGNE